VDAFDELLHDNWELVTPTERRFRVRREAKRHAAFKSEEARSEGMDRVAVEKRRRRCALPAQSKIGLAPMFADG
jgi:hypothetical protein